MRTFQLIRKARAWLMALLVLPALLLAPAAAASPSLIPPSLEDPVQSAVRPPSAYADPAPLFRASVVADPESYLVLLRNEGAPDADSPDRLAADTHAAARRLRAAGIEVTDVLPGIGALTVRATNTQLTRVRMDPSVAFVQEDGVVRASAVEQSPAASWGLDRIDQAQLPLDGVFSTTLMGTGVTVYLLDSGLRADHNEFTGRITDSFNTVDDGFGTDDCWGHGTHVAGTALGSTYGVARAARLVNVRVLNCDLTGTWSDLLEGLDWVARHAQLPAVTNFSIIAEQSEALDEGVRRVTERGITVVVAAGNMGKDACAYSPASLPEVITVGGTNKYDQRHPTSNYGQCVDVWAPGKDIISAFNYSEAATATLTGTSMATPHVTGAVALYLQNHPDATPAQVKEAILGAATPDVLSGLGSGSPNRLLGIAALQPAPDPNTDPEPPAPPQPPVLASALGTQISFSDDWSETPARSMRTDVLREGDEVLAGDWNGDGVDSLGVRRGNKFLLWDGDPVGAPTYSFWYGKPEDPAFVGDWDNDGRDGIAVRRGNVYHLRDSLTTGDAQRTVEIGTTQDEAWAGRFETSQDALVLRAPGSNLFRFYSWDASKRPRTAWYGMAGEPVVVGDWDGDGIDGLGIRRNNVWHLRYAPTTGNADVTVWREPTRDVIVIGDWDRDNRDTIAALRAVVE